MNFFFLFKRPPAAPRAIPAPTSLGRSLLGGTLTTMTRVVRCGECDTELAGASDPDPATNDTCPNCGSTRRTTAVAVGTALERERVPTAGGSPSTPQRSADAITFPTPVTARVEVPAVLVWQNYRHAPDWYADCSAEASKEGGGARRREIVFAVCLAASYLSEWVLTEALLEDRFTRFFDYFPENDRRGLTEIWKVTTDRLHQEGALPRTPNLGGPHGEEWKRLTRFRDGLVHASASRPSTPSAMGDDLPKPSPSPEDLDALDPGWALGVTVEHIKRLHEAAASRAPSWLIAPRTG